MNLIDAFLGIITALANINFHSRITSFRYNTTSESYLSGFLISNAIGFHK